MLFIVEYVFCGGQTVHVKLHGFVGGSLVCGLTLIILLTSVATSPRVRVIRAADIAALRCWTSQKVLPKVSIVLSPSNRNAKSP